MYYGLELPIEAPKVAIWDMLPMMLYISLLKDRYDKAQEKMDKFAEKYGALSSLLPIDNANLKGMVGGMYQKISDMENAGIDPYRSAEGIGTINRLIREANSAKFAEMLASAKRYEEFEKSRAKAMQNGTYNEALERNLFGGKLASEWNTMADGIFPVVAMPEMKSLTELTDNVYKQFAPQELLKRGDQDPDLKKKFGNESRFYNIFGVSDANKAKALAAAKQAIDNTMYGQIYRQQAAEQFLAQFAMLSKVNPTEAASMTDAQKQAAIDKIYGDMIEAAQAQYLQPKLEKNQIGLDMWKESLANWRTLRAHSGSGNGNNSTNTKLTYSALLNSSESNIGRIAGNAQPKVVTVIKNGKKVATVQNAFAQAQSKILTNVIKNGGSHKQMINKLSGTYDGGNFAKYMGRKAVDEDNNTVYMQSHDVKDLYTANLLINNAWGIKKKSVDTKTQDYLTKVLAPAVINAKGETELNAVRMHATGRITTVMDQQGRVHTYREVYVPAIKKNMYYDLHYEYYSNDEGGLSFDENASVGAMQSDYRSGSDYGLSANANKQLPD